nr:hypothetical protein [uncultured organism]
MYDSLVKGNRSLLGKQYNLNSFDCNRVSHWVREKATRHISVSAACVIISGISHMAATPYDIISDMPFLLSYAIGNLQQPGTIRIVKW